MGKNVEALHSTILSRVVFDDSFSRNGGHHALKCILFLLSFLQWKLSIALAPTLIFYKCHIVSQVQTPRELSTVICNKAACGVGVSAHVSSSSKFTPQSSPLSIKPLFPLFPEIVVRGSIMAVRHLVFALYRQALSDVRQQTQIMFEAGYMLPVRE